MADARKRVRQNQRNSHGTLGFKQEQKDGETEKECDMKGLFQMMSRSTPNSTNAYHNVSRTDAPVLVSIEK